MNDLKIRETVHKQILLNSHACTDTLVVDELGIKNGFVRADIAVLNGTLAAFEIKGADDSFHRLERQIHAYDSVFVYSSLVTSPNHLDKAILHLPSHWGLYVAQDKQDCIHLKKIRNAKKNKNTDSLSIAQLLWKDEAHQLIERYLNQSVSQRRTRKELYLMLATAIPKTKLIKATLEILKARTHWRIDRAQHA